VGGKEEGWGGGGKGGGGRGGVTAEAHRAEGMRREWEGVIERSGERERGEEGLGEYSPFPRR